jgi:ABC-type uncharacterized transport system permease subunit
MQIAKWRKFVCNSRFAICSLQFAITVHRPMIKSVRRPQMLSNVSIICFAACYAIALIMELVSLKAHISWRRAGLLVTTVAGLVAHSLYLWTRAAQSQAAPLSAPAEWLLLAAWVLVFVYLGALVNIPRAASGVILLPIILGLTVASIVASNEPFAPERASEFWSRLHGAVLLLGTVTVCVGFAAGVMYLLQSYWLKHKKSPATDVRLPSLEWLERINKFALGVSALLVGLGLVSGLILSQLRHRGESDYQMWSDPVVWSLAAMFVWLVVAEVFRLVYPAARRGRKVAYLTLASFGFLLIVLASFVFVDQLHGGTSEQTVVRTANGVE